MFLPKGNDVWVDLSTSFIDIDKLLLFLKHQEFTGYLNIVLSDIQCVICLQEGDVINGLTQTKWERKSGQKITKEFLDQIRLEKSGTLTITRLPLETVIIFSELFCFNVKLVYKNLSPEFSHLGKFLVKLKKQAVTGYIEIHFSKDKKQVIIFLEKGIIKAIFTDEIQIRLKEQTKSELKLIILKLIDEAQRNGALYDLLEAF